MREGGEARRRISNSPPVLPALEQVTGWGKSDPAKPLYDPDGALFSGWRLEDWKARK